MELRAGEFLRLFLFYSKGNQQVIGEKANIMDWKNKFISLITATRPMPVDRNRIKGTILSVVDALIARIKKHCYVDDPLNSSNGLCSIDYEQAFILDWTPEADEFFTDIHGRTAKRLFICLETEESDRQAMVLGAHCDVQYVGDDLNVMVTVSLNGSKPMRDFIIHRDSLDVVFYSIFAHEYNHFKCGEWHKEPKYYNQDESINMEKYYATWDEVKAFMQEYSAICDVIINRTIGEVTEDNLRHYTGYVLKHLYSYRNGVLLHELGQMPKQQQDTIKKGLWTYITQELQKKIQEDPDFY